MGQFNKVLDGVAARRRAEKKYLLYAMVPWLTGGSGREPPLRRGPDLNTSDHDERQRGPGYKRPDCWPAGELNRERPWSTELYRFAACLSKGPTLWLRSYVNYRLRSVNEDICGRIVGQDANVEHAIIKQRSFPYTSPHTDRPHSFALLRIKVIGINRLFRHGRRDTSILAKHRIRWRHSPAVGVATKFITGDRLLEFRAVTQNNIMRLGLSSK